MGLMLLVLMPVPYVDASSSSLFRSKFERAVVGAAGMMVELVLASIAFYIWLLAEPGTVRAVAFNVMLIAGVSTVLFNGNPLLRYDAYYILADLIEIRTSPAARCAISVSCSNAICSAPARSRSRTQPGARKSGSCSTASARSCTGSWWWWRSFCSSPGVFVIGVVLAIWAVIAMAVVPVGKTVHHLATAPRLARYRRRVVTVSIGVLALIVGFIIFVPMPFRSQTEGVVWLPEQQIVRAGANGFLSRYLVQPGRASPQAMR